MGTSSASLAKIFFVKELTIRLPIDSVTHFVRTESNAVVRPLHGT